MASAHTREVYYRQYLPASRIVKFLERGWCTSKHTPLENREISVSSSGARGPWRFQHVPDERALRAKLVVADALKYDMGAAYGGVPGDARGERKRAHAELEAAQAELRRARSSGEDPADEFTLEAREGQAKRRTAARLVLADKAAVAALAVGAELRFEIDMNDYLWLGVGAGQMVLLDRYAVIWQVGLALLRETLLAVFAYEHTLAWYSGRRGGALVVLDEAAFALSNEARATVAAAVQPRDWTKPDAEHDFVNAPLLQPVFGRASENYAKVGAVADEHFDKWQQRDVHFTEALLRLFGNVLLPSGGGRAQDKINEQMRIARRMLSPPAGGVERPALWSAVRLELQNSAEGRAALHRALFRAFWPRLDVGVTRQTEHLLKGPFSPHPATDRICVPMLPYLAPTARFDPRSAPTTAALARNDARALEAMQFAVAVMGSTLRRAKAGLGAAAPEAAAPPPLEGGTRVVDLRSLTPRCPESERARLAELVASTAEVPRVCVLTLLTVGAHVDEAAREVVLECRRTLAGGVSKATRVVPTGGFAPYRDEPLRESWPATIAAAVAAAVERGGGVRFVGAMAQRLVFTNLSASETAHQVAQFAAKPGAWHELMRLPLSSLWVGDDDGQAVRSIAVSKVVPFLRASAEYVEVDEGSPDGLMLEERPWSTGAAP
jgi:DNA primase catalytic subunit